MIVPESFDPYVKWLGIRDPQRPPNHYRLLGLELFESDPDVIAAAADRQMSHVRTYQTGPQAEASQRLLNELATARVCLLRADKKAAYDARLRAQLDASAVKPSSRPPLPSSLPAGSKPVARPVKAEPVHAGEQDHASKDVESRRRQLFALTSLALVALAGIAALVVWRMGRDDPRTASNSTDKPAARLTQPNPSEAKHDPPIAPSQGNDSKRKPTDPPVHVPPERVQPIQPPPENTTASPAAAPAPAEQTKPSPRRTPQPSSSPSSLPSDELVRLLAQARQDLAERNVDAARSALNEAHRFAKPAERSSVSRWQRIAAIYSQFWNAVRSGSAMLNPGQALLRADGQYAVVQRQRQPDSVTLAPPMGGAAVTYTLATDEIDGTLAVEIAEHSYRVRGAPAPKAVLAVFWAVDAAGDRTLARKLWDEARLEDRSLDTLLPEFEQALATEPTRRAKPSAEAPDDGPLVFGPRPLQPKGRIAKPSDDQLQAALKTARELFADEKAKATTLERKRALVDAILRSAGAGGNNPTEVFALFTLARETAVAAGDAALAISAIEGRTIRFAIDPLPEKTAALAAIGKLAIGPALSQSLADAALTAADEAARDDRYSLALDFAKLAVSAAAKSKHRDTVQQANQFDKELREQEKAFQAAAKAYETWKNSPADPEASLELGRYLCFIKDDWKHGLPILKGGSDPQLQELAGLEVAGTLTAPQQATLADAWWDAAAKAGPAKPQYLSRARHWYESALPQLAGLERAKVEKRLDAIGASVGSKRTASKTLQIPLGNNVAINFVWILPGRFLMGSAASEQVRGNDETQHPVTISRGFYLAVTELTQEQWTIVAGSNPSSPDRQANLPVQNITWDECQQYCAAIQAVQNRTRGKHYRFRLPTEAEWEYACRANSTTRYFFGDVPAQAFKYAWCSGRGSRINPVGSLAANGWGLYDMLGNVQEWCSDWYAPLPAVQQTDPAGPPMGRYRVFRGGDSSRAVFRSAERAYSLQTDRHTNIGLRLVAEPQ